MIITMLGYTGSGKTTYMSAMSQLFVDGDVQGFYLRDRPGIQDNKFFIRKAFKGVNTIFTENRFPDGTSSSTTMYLSLFRSIDYNHNDYIIDIDWIDYRGGMIMDIAHGNQEDDVAQLSTVLMATDVVLVFVDATILKNETSEYKIKSLIGANEIVNVLNDIYNIKPIEIVFLLSKSDSDLIDIGTDLQMLKSRAEKAFNMFFIKNNLEPSNFQFIPVGSVGINRVKTSIIVEPKTRQKVYSVSIIDDPLPYNIHISFAYALEKCIVGAMRNKEDEFDKITKRLKDKESHYGWFQKFWDSLLFGSRTRNEIIDIKNDLNNKHLEILQLNPYRDALSSIWKGRI